MKEKNNSIAIQGIEVVSFTLVPRPKTKDVTKIHYGINVECQTKVNAEKRLLFIIANVKITEKDTEQIMGSLVVNVLFEIANFNEIAVQQKNLIYNIDPTVSKRLTMITLNTVRGITFAYFRGTYLHKVLIPFIDDDTLVETYE